MKTAREWNECFLRDGLIETINDFCDYVGRTTGIMPDFSFAHIALDDFNLSNNDIEWCLDNERVNCFLIDTYGDWLSLGAMDHTSGNSWENYNYWDLINGTQLTIDFMNWLMTIPEDERDRQCELYYEGAT